MAWDVPEGPPGPQWCGLPRRRRRRTRGYFETSSAGGTATMPLEKQAWGDEAGALADRFGITWMVDVTR